jgi:(p)ppGpp synthase/HD superfamily hydrolase
MMVRQEGALGAPTFVQDRPLTLEALRFATRAHAGATRDGDGAPFILHPLEVSSLLSSCDCPDPVTAAAILHDTLENTAATADEISARFGREVARFVRCLTENERIADEAERKSALRDPRPAAARHEPRSRTVRRPRREVSAAREAVNTRG